MSILPINLMRYLIFLKVNAPMVWFRFFPSMEFSLVLGTLISESLPSVQARPWKKSLEPWKKHGGITSIKKNPPKRPPNAPWPVESVIFSYPGKRAYGEGELILMELKLFGEAADHGFFLEVILPAIEKASHTIDWSWQKSNSLWGKFDIEYIYAARGRNWDVLVDQKTLNLKYMATPRQWCENLFVENEFPDKFQRLKWITPFDLQAGKGQTTKFHKEIPQEHIPSLKDILLAFLTRLEELPTAQHNRFWDTMNGETKDLLDNAVETASTVQMTDGYFKVVQESQYGTWVGRQDFETIPEPILPYLSLASLFHVGAYTHYGCGTFLIE